MKINKIRLRVPADSVVNLAKLMGDLKMNSKSVYVTIGVLCLMTMMYFTGQWVGRQTSSDGSFGNEFTLNEEELSMLTRNEFLEVSKILNDPKTTTQEPKYQGIQSVTEKTPIMAPPLTKSDISPNDFITIEEVASIKPPKTKDIFVNHWVRDLSSSKICQSNNKHDPLLLCIVVSAPSHFKERAGIREGWGKTAFKGKKTAIIYLVGVPDQEDLQNYPNLRDEILNESDTYRDLAITDNVDVYKNLTLKTIAAFDWARQFCPEADFLLKTDDDMFIHMKRLLLTIKSLRVSTLSPNGIIVGNVAAGWKPVRNPQSKYYITQEQYTETSYPPFVTGPSYLISRPAFDLLQQAAMNRPFFHLEDVFITGIVAESVDVPRRLATEFRNNANPIPARFLGCTLTKTISIHKVKPEEQVELSEMAKNPQCGKRRNQNYRKIQNSAMLSEIQK